MRLRHSAACVPPDLPGVAATRWLHRRNPSRAGDRALSCWGVFCPTQTPALTPVCAGVFHQSYTLEVSQTTPSLSTPVSPWAWWRRLVAESRGVAGQDGHTAEWTALFTVRCTFLPMELIITNSNNNEGLNIHRQLKCFCALQQCPVEVLLVFRNNWAGIIKFPNIPLKRGKEKPHLVMFLYAGKADTRLTQGAGTTLNLRHLGSF